MKAVARRRRRATASRCRRRRSKRRSSAAGTSLAYQRSAPPHSMSRAPAALSGAAVEGSESRQSVRVSRKMACADRAAPAPEAVRLRRLGLPRRGVRAARTAAGAPESRSHACPSHHPLAEIGSGRTGPAVEGRQGALRLGSSKRRVCSSRGSGITLSDTSGMAPRMPSEPHRRRATSKPATFLITLPPKRSNWPSPRAARHPDEVACRSGARAPRAENPQAMTPPSVGSAPSRRLEREELPVACQQRLDFREPRAAARGDDELGGLVIDHAAVATEVEQRAFASLTVEILGARAAEAQRGARAMGFDDAVRSS